MTERATCDLCNGELGPKECFECAAAIKVTKLAREWRARVGAHGLEMIRTLVCEGPRVFELRYKGSLKPSWKLSGLTAIQSAIKIEMIVDIWINMPFRHKNIIREIL